MPRPDDPTRCPHCDAELPAPRPLACPHCAGSLRQRYLKAGCLSSAPKLALFATALWWLVEWRLGRG